MEAIVALVAVLLPGMLLLFRLRFRLDYFASALVIITGVMAQLAGGHFSDAVLGWGAFPGWFAVWLALMFLAMWYPTYRRNRAGRQAIDARIAAETAAEQSALKAKSLTKGKKKTRKAGHHQRNA